MAGERRRLNWRGFWVYLASVAVVGGLMWLVLPSRFHSAVLGGVGGGGLAMTLLALFNRYPSRRRDR